MTFSQVTATEMQAARLLMGATMVGLLGARFFKGRAQVVRIAVACVYIAGIVSFIAYFTL